MRRTTQLIFGIVTCLSIAANISAAEPARLKLLFLGDNGHHQPAVRFKQIQPVLADRKIELVYTDVVTDLNPTTLKDYDGVVVYANIDTIDDAQAKSLLDFVAAGKGFVPLHCASFCFRNNAQIVALIGAQFQRHGTGTVRTNIVKPDHPVMRGFKGFESWDETYVHTKHNEKDRTVLETRPEKDTEEPWTWVRTHGNGRVFYTAWGHDGRTFGNPGFQNLVERGIRWACGQDPSSALSFTDRPEMTKLPSDAKPFEYVEANVPFYPPGRRWGTVENGKRQMQLPLSPEESMKHFVTPVGFEVKLFASEKDFQGKPIAMNWDERGRLWICETLDYPNELKPAGQGRDRIRILEDTDGDWVADKFTVFADKLSIPTAITFYRGGAIVQDGRETIYLKDVDGDDKADLRKVLITGWAMNDTHGEVSNFQFGLDNWYYAMQGYNASSPVLTDGRRVTSFKQGFFRFKVEENPKTNAQGAAGKGANEQPDPVVTDLEFLRSTNNNTWGLGLSEEGLVFGSTANGNPSEFMPIPNRYYEAVRGWSSTVLNGIADSNKFEALDEGKVRQVDHHGGFTAAAGHALYTARNYPKEYWNRAAFVTEATGHLIATFILREDGAGYRSKNSWNLLASNDEWSGPIMAEVGPDGNVWVIDWYNYIIQHNPTPTGFQNGRGNAYETELRDKKHGRIYRIVYNGATEKLGQATASVAKDGDNARMTAMTMDLSKANSEQLLATLHSSNFLWRRHAQRLMLESRQADVVQPLIDMVKEQSLDEIGLATDINHALWTLHGRGALDGHNRDALKVTVRALNHPSAGVRRNAALVLPHDDQSAQAIVQSGVLRDKNAQVRLAALLALAEMPPSAEAAEAIHVAMSVSENLQDHWLHDALIAAAARHDLFFMKAVIKSSGGKPASPPEDVLLIVAEHYARGGPTDSIGSLLAAVGAAKDDVKAALITGFSKGWPRGKTATFDDATESALVDLMKNSPPATRGPLATFAARAGSKKVEEYGAEIASSFLTIAKDDKQSDAARRDASIQLVTFRRTDASVAKELLSMIGPRISPDLGKDLIDAIGRSEAPEVGAMLVESLASFTPSLRPTAIRVLLSRGDWTEALLDGIDKGAIQPADLSLDQKQGLSAHPNKKIADRAKTILSRSGGLPNPDRAIVLQKLLPLTDQTGDAVAGKEIFKKQCAKCHTHSGEGTKIGPDLTGMAVHPKVELLTHIIDPSRSVEGNFRVYSVILTDGRVMNGLLASESKTAIEIFDAEGKKHAIQRDDIDEIVASKKSLMPEGFENQIKPDELTNLLEFLTQRGKYLPIPINKAATIVTTREMFHNGRHDEQKLIFSDWSPKVFEGIPFVLVDPQGDRAANAIMLYGTSGDKPPLMPKSVSLTCNSGATAIHVLGGISGWGWPATQEKKTCVIVRLRYADGQSEDHPLMNGEQFADYIRRVDVPMSKFAYSLRGQQIRYFSIVPKRTDVIETIELVKGDDLPTCPIFMAITVETAAKSESK